MKNRAVIFNAPFSAQLQTGNEDEILLENDELLCETQFSLISPGTELAIYKGTEAWAPLPYNPGYAGIGIIRKAGEGVDEFNEGQIVFHYSAHKQWTRVSTRDVVVKIADGVNLKQALFIRMAAVSITALRVAPIELGDSVVVVGMGLVGNLAAQLYALAGAKVIGVDISEERLALAEECGIRHTVNPAKTNVRDTVRNITGGEYADVTVDATGVPSLIESAFTYTKPAGDVVLLGSPRGTFEADITSLLNKVHLWGENGCVSLKGAHEWRYPVKPTAGCKHSIQRNCEIIHDLIAADQLKVKPLISHVLSPDKCQDAYQGLLNNKDEYAGVIFDWQIK